MSNGERWVWKRVGEMCAQCLFECEQSLTRPVRGAPFHTDCECAPVLLRPGDPEPDWLTLLIGILYAARHLASADATEKEIYAAIRQLYPDLVSDGVFLRPGPV